jgi:hypothetical protein
MHHSVGFIVSSTDAVRQFSGGIPLRLGKTSRSGMFCGVKFFAQYTDAASAQCAGQIIVDMERIGVSVDSNTKKKRRTTFGRVYAPMTINELQALMLRLHSRDRHLYESLSEQPTKLVLDIDRPLPSDSTHADLQRLDHALKTHFLPALCEVLNDLIVLPSAAALTPVDFLVLDASLPAYKYSKHLIMHTSPAIACSPRRDIEKSVMGTFRDRLQDMCLRDSSLREFCYYQHGGHASKEAVDFSIYSNGKRSMRLPACCKGDGKCRNTTARLLLPDRQFCSQDLPFTVFMCNVVAPDVAVCWSPRSPLAVCVPRPRQQPLRIHPHTQSHLTIRPHAVCTSTSAVPSPVSVCLAAIADSIHPHYTSRRMSSGVTPAGDLHFVTMLINYKASSATEERSCAFGCERHSRHYASVSLYSNGASEYFCFGCQDTTVLTLPQSQVETAVSVQDDVVRHEGEFVELISRYLPGCTLTQCCTKYLPVCPMTQNLQLREMCIARSGMGTGKTHMIGEYIKTLSASRPELTVVSIGFRQTLNTALAMRLGLQNYLTAETASLHGVPRLSIQLDSLARLLQPGQGDDGLFVLPRPYDVVIIDEIESLLTHFTSTTMQDKALLCWRIFESVLSNCTKLIVCDADLGDRAIAFLAGLDRDPKFTCVLRNTFSPHVTEHVVVHNVVTFTKKLHRHAVKQRRKVYLASNSKTYAHHAQSLLVTAGLRVLLIEGASPPAVKAAAADCDRTWGDYDAVICTPAVAAGIDCSIHHFDDVFVYGTNGSNTGRELNQQRGRVRHVASRTVHVCIDTVRRADNKVGTGDAGECSSRMDLQQTMAAIMGSTRALFEDIRTCVLPSVAGEPAAMGIRVTQCPQPLLRIIAASRMERERSVGNMTREYEHAVVWADTKAVFRKLPVSAARYASMLTMEIHNLHIAQHEAHEIMMAEYAPSCAQDTGMEDTRLYQKAKLGDFYGGVDFRCCDAVFHFMPESRQQTMRNIWTSFMPVEDLFMSDRSLHGSFSSQTLTDLHSHISHTVHHKIVLEEQLPSWVQRIFSIIMLFAAGCVGVSVALHEGAVTVVPDVNIVTVVARDGLCSALSSTRLRDRTLQAWLCRQAPHFMAEGTQKVPESFDARVTIQMAKLWLTRTYGLKWSKCTVKRRRVAGGAPIRNTVSHPSADLLRLSVLGVGLHSHTYTDEERATAAIYWAECMAFTAVRLTDKQYLMREAHLADYSCAIPTLPELKRRTACKVGLSGRPKAAHVASVPTGGTWSTCDTARVTTSVDRVLRCLYVATGGDL